MLATFPNNAQAQYIRRKDVNLYAPDNAFQVLHDWQLAEYEYLPRQFNPDYEQAVAVPATRRMRGFGSLPMSKEWQFYWFESLLWNCDGKLSDEAVKEIWIRLTAHNMAFTDGHSREQGYQDFITGANPNGSPMEFSGIICTGNVIKQKFAGVKYRWLEALDITKAPPKLLDVVKDRPYLIQWATEQTLQRRGDRWAVSAFPHFENHLGVPFGVPVPVFGIGGENTIEIEYAEKIAKGSYTPYV